MVTLIDTLQRKPSELRHPEKQNRPESVVLKKPDWLRVKAPGSGQYNATKDIVRSKGCTRSAKRRPARTSASAGARSTPP
jgi:lipoyl synthase